MILYAVIDPRVFSEERVMELNTGMQVCLFLSGVVENVCLVVDGEGRIEADLARISSRYSSIPKRGQRISLLLTEIIKMRKKRFVRSQLRGFPMNFSDSSYDEKIMLIAKSVLVDGVITSDEFHRKFNEIGVPIEYYDTSEFEFSRKEYAKNSKPLDLIGEDNVKSIIKRCTRTSQVIYIFDKQIGKLNNVSGFSRGLIFLIENWLSSVPNRKEGYDVEIITESHVRISEADSQDERENLLKLNYDKAIELKKKLTDPICRKFKSMNLRIKVKFKSDTTDLRIMHDRFLVTSSGIFRFTRGFDIFNGEGKLCRQWTFVEGLDESHIRECSALPDATPPIMSP